MLLRTTGSSFIVEMIEAVGPEFLNTYFQVCNQLLHPVHGIMVFQCITMPEERYESYCRGADFIQTYIFPGGHCPSLTRLVGAVNDGSKCQLTVDDVENIGPHYARTLRVWREVFVRNYDKQLRNFPKYLPPKEGWFSAGASEKVPFYSEEFRRKWLYYFAYCEAGFRTRSIGNLQVVLTRSNNMQFVDGKEQIML